jgi:hypothetical protein
LAARLGDAAWKEVLGGHGDGVRRQLDRYRGLEVATTGDGFLALFDGARVPSVAPPRFASAPRMTGCRSVPASTQARSSGRPVTFAASPFMPSPESRPSRSLVRCSSPLQRSVSSKDQISNSRTPASTSSGACRGGGGSTASPRPRLTTASTGR